MDRRWGECRGNLLGPTLEKKGKEEIGGDNISPHCVKTWGRVSEKTNPTDICSYRERSQPSVRHQRQAAFWSGTDALEDR